MATVAEILRENQGTITVARNRPRRGVSIYFPDSSQAKTAKPYQGERPFVERTDILLVEDRGAARRCWLDRLTLAGY